MRADPKSTKKTDGLTVFFARLVSALVKATRNFVNMLMKSTLERLTLPGLDILIFLM